MPKFYSRYNRGPKTPFSFKVDGKKPVGRTKQSFKDECDVNRIVAHAARTGVLPNRGGNPLYGDFSEVPDYQAALSVVQSAEGKFNSLPAQLRARFKNDPGQFLEYIGNPDNHEEAARLGLMKPEAVQRVEESKKKKKSTPPKGGSDEPVDPT